MLVSGDKAMPTTASGRVNDSPAICDKHSPRFGVYAVIIAGWFSNSNYSASEIEKKYKSYILLHINSVRSSVTLK